MPDGELELLRRANDGLYQALSELQKAPRIPPAWFTGLRVHLQQAASSLHGIELNASLPASWQAEIARHREFLLALAQILPALQTRLLAERARLQSARERLQGIQSWADALR